MWHVNVLNAFEKWALFEDDIFVDSHDTAKAE